jgi:hypothetical protein
VTDTPHSTPSETVHQPTAKELRDQIVTHTQQMIELVGGTWKTDTPGNNPNAPLWDPVTSKLTGGPCDLSASNGPEQFDISLYGPPIPDPAAKTAEVLAHWDSLGYETWTVSPTNTKPTGMLYTHIAADATDGAQLGYSASTEGSSIDVQSVCSTDPSVTDVHAIIP